MSCRALFLRTVVLVLASFPVMLAAESNDSHLNGSDGTLYRHSAYAHGFIHGYEEGFHFGNLDIHLAHARRSPPRPLSTDHQKQNYRSEFGDKKFFKKGYAAGFVAGYNDVQDQRPFRAVEMSSAVAAGMNGGDRPHVEYDRAFEAGYAEGQKTGHGAYNWEAFQSSCLGSERGRDAMFCDAYGRGFKLGSLAGGGEQTHSAQARPRPGGK